MQNHREHWGSHLGFILAAAGSAIGLGTLWKFPYVTGENGGGLFVLVYILCTFFIGIPVFVAELLLGRKAQRGAVGVFDSLSRRSSFWKVTGWLGVISSFVILSYYSVLAGWGLNYVFMSLSKFYEGRTVPEIQQVFDQLSKSGDITLFWQAAFLAITTGLVYPGVRQGIEYWSKWMTSSLFVLLIALACYACTLEGFWKAVHFVFYPHAATLKPSGVLEALGLSFFTLSLGQGVMLTYGSYMEEKEDIPKTSGIIASTIIFASLLAALVIFPIIFTFGFSPEGGRGLVFKTLPVLFSKLPGAILISTAFFTLFVFTALTSAVALVEVVVANFIDLLGWSRRKAVMVTGIGAFLFGIPSALSETHTLFANWEAIYGKTFFATVDDLTTVWLLPIGGMLIALFTGFVLDKEVAKKEFLSGTKWGWLFTPWLFFIRWIVPIAIGLIILQQSGLIQVDTLFR